MGTAAMHGYDRDIWIDHHLHAAAARASRERVIVGASLERRHAHMWFGGVHVYHGGIDPTSSQHGLGVAAIESGGKMADAARDISIKGQISSNWLTESNVGAGGSVRDDR